jgi:hypothetical protein
VVSAAATSAAPSKLTESFAQLPIVARAVMLGGSGVAGRLWDAGIGQTGLSRTFGVLSRQEWSHSPPFRKYGGGMLDDITELRTFVRIVGPGVCPRPGDGPCPQRRQQTTRDAGVSDRRADLPKRNAPLQSSLTSLRHEHEAKSVGRETTSEAAIRTPSSSRTGT